MASDKRWARRAQSSIEFMVITGVGLLLISTAAIAFLSYTKQSSDDARLSQVNSMANDILGQASWVYSLGGYSWVTVEANIPEGVTDIYVVENNALVFDVQTQHGVVSQPIFSTTPITGVNTVGAKSFVYSAPLTVHQGLMKFRVTGTGAIVEIRAVS